MSSENETCSQHTEHNNELISSKFIVLLERCEILQHALDQGHDDDTSRVVRMLSFGTEMN
jgi:hypothetical protein